MIRDRNFAEKFLQHLNYYRFSGYCLAFEGNRHEFLSGTTFEQVKAAYDFDVALRDLLTEALEVIEVDVRSCLAYILGEMYGAFGHTDTKHFRRGFRHLEWKDKLDKESIRSNELFVVHFKNAYAEFPNLPVWMATEIMSFGSLSIMFQGLLDNCQSAISRCYGMQKSDFGSTLHHLCYVRNLCAHHSRTWDREWSISPRLPRGRYWGDPYVIAPNRLFVTLLLIYRLLKCMPAIEAFTKEWHKRVNVLMRTPPLVTDPQARMGMTPTWYQHPLWL